MRLSGSLSSPKASSYHTALTAPCTRALDLSLLDVRWTNHWKKVYSNQIDFADDEVTPEWRKIPRFKKFRAGLTKRLAEPTVLPWLRPVQPNLQVEWVRKRCMADLRRNPKFVAGWNRSRDGYVPDNKYMLEGPLVGRNKNLTCWPNTEEISFVTAGSDVVRLQLLSQLNQREKEEQEEQEEDVNDAQPSGQAGFWSNIYRAQADKEGMPTLSVGRPRVNPLRMEPLKRPVGRPRKYPLLAKKLKAAANVQQSPSPPPTSSALPAATSSESPAATSPESPAATSPESPVIWPWMQPAIDIHGLPTVIPHNVHSTHPPIRQYLKPNSNPHDPRPWFYQLFKVSCLAGIGIGKYHQVDVPRIPALPEIELLLIPDVDMWLFALDSIKKVHMLVYGQSLTAAEESGQLWKFTRGLKGEKVYLNHQAIDYRAYTTAIHDLSNYMLDKLPTTQHNVSNRTVVLRSMYFHVASILIRLTAPIAPFVAEECWRIMYGISRYPDGRQTYWRKVPLATEMPVSVMLHAFPDLPADLKEKLLAQRASLVAKGNRKLKDPSRRVNVLT